MATYVKPARGTASSPYGETKFGYGLSGMGAKAQKGAAQKPGSGLWGYGFDPADPNLEANVEAWLAKHQRADGTYVDDKGRPINWMNGTDGGTWGKKNVPAFVKLKELYPNEKASTLFDAAFRGAMSESSIPPTNFFTEYLLDPLVEAALTVGGNLIAPGLGTIGSTLYGAGRGGSENGLLGAVTGGLGGYAVGSGVTGIQSGIQSAGGVGNYLSNAGKSAYNAVTNLPSTIGNLGKDALGYIQYGPELTNVNAALGGSAASGMAQGASGALRAAAAATDSGAGGFVNNLLPGGRGASAIGQLGSSAVGGGGMDLGGLIKFATDVALPIYTSTQTQKAIKSGAAGQTAAANAAIGLQREMYEKGVELSKPWYEAGTNALAEQQRLLGLGAAGRGTEGYGSLAKPFTMADFQADPGYAFRMAEGQKALERSAAARGGLLSGGTGRALTRYGQNVAADEYQNAFNRYYKAREAQLNPLQSLSGTGQTTASQMGTAGTTFGTAAGNTMENIANINAARNMYGTLAQNQMLNQIMGRVSAYGQPQQPSYYGV